MNDILITNIFFVITGISSIIITIVLVIALTYLIRFTRRLNSISKSVQKETLHIIDDVEEVRGAVRQHISVARNVMSAAFVKGLVEKLFTGNNNNTYEKTNNKKSK